MTWRCTIQLYFHSHQQRPRLIFFWKTLKQSSLCFDTGSWIHISRWLLISITFSLKAQIDHSTVQDTVKHLSLNLGSRMVLLVMVDSTFSYLRISDFQHFLISLSELPCHHEFSFPACKWTELRLKQMQCHLLDIFFNWR